MHEAGEDSGNSPSQKTSYELIVAKLYAGGEIGVNPIAFENPLEITDQGKPVRSQAFSSSLSRPPLLSAVLLSTPRAGLNGLDRHAIMQGQRRRCAGDGALASQLQKMLLKMAPPAPMVSPSTS